MNMSQESNVTFDHSHIRDARACSLVSFIFLFSLIAFQAVTLQDIFYRKFDTLFLYYILLVKFKPYFLVA